MATTVTTTKPRGRAAVLDDLAYYRHKAARMICTDPDFAVCHAVLNSLLDELGY